MKKSSKNTTSKSATKSTTPKSTATTAKAKAKEPLISTGKKLGLTIYFTFVFTLMGVMGLQIWMNSANNGIANDLNNTPQVTTQEIVDNQDTQTTKQDYDLTNTSFDNDTTTPTKSTQHTFSVDNNNNANTSIDNQSPLDNQNTQTNVSTNNNLN